MVAEAIVYESNTGYTKKYAALLAEAAGLKAYERKNAAPFLKKGTAIIYMGWIMAGGVKGYKKALKEYDVKALVGVGLAIPSEKAASDIAARYQITDMPVFYLQGGLDMNKLHGMDRVIMKNMAKIMRNSMSKKESQSEADVQMLALIENGGSFVCLDNLEAVLTWLKQ